MDTDKQKLQKKLDRAYDLIVDITIAKLREEMKIGKEEEAAIRMTMRTDAREDVLTIVKELVETYRDVVKNPL